MTSVHLQPFARAGRNDSRVRAPSQAHVHGVHGVPAKDKGRRFRAPVTLLDNNHPTATVVRNATGSWNDDPPGKRARQ